MSNTGRVKNFELMLAREKAGLSQGQLATEVGSDRQWLTQIENGYGNPSQELADAIAKRLNTDREKLFPGKLRKKA